ncbi:hypothetical protein Agub_g7033 [Astrephomene gubernaculifera]|uniref:tRNA-guanine(15) transglycosylase-like domain-containing protein n=1 Tax=Astrephomene gubernaculifera TaxID=47775 RepID=A0AAD3DPF7_9CHLO|nr:hypothetical protein Agub_g7033 [Astrephomene gubernaculifera]
MYEFGARPCTDKEIHVSIHSGGHMVGPERYMETVAALQPDMYVTLCDEVPADSKPKRVSTSVRRTTAWLDTCLQLHARYQQPQPQQGQEQQQPLQRGQQRGQLKAAQRQKQRQQQLERERERQQQQGQQQQPQQPQEEATEAAATAALQQQQQASANGAADGVAEDGVGEGPLSGSLVFAALGGGALPAERQRAAAAVAGKEGVAGYALCGLGTGESPSARPALIAASLAGLEASSSSPTAPVAASTSPASSSSLQLLSSLPVFAAGVGGSPEEVLQAVAAGVDLLDCSFVAQVTAAGYALTFPLRPPPDWQPQTSADASAVEAAAAVESSSGPLTLTSAAQPATTASSPDGSDETKINLWSTSYRLDTAPLLPGCGCSACRQHTRAYLHHLLQAHEMLADVLLEAHNTSHMQAFVQAIREAIAEGQLQRYQQWFASLRSGPVLPPAGPPRKGKRRALGPPGSPAPSAEAEGAVEVEEGAGGDSHAKGSGGAVALGGDAVMAEAADVGAVAAAKWVRV